MNEERKEQIRALATMIDELPEAQREFLHGYAEGVKATAGEVKE